MSELKNVKATPAHELFKNHMTRQMQSWMVLHPEVTSGEIIAVLSRMAGYGCGLMPADQREEALALAKKNFHEGVKFIEENGHAK